MEIPTEHTPALVFDAVNFGYGGTPVLENLSFSTPVGAFMLIIGPNVGGKTTLLRLMLGLLSPQSGRIRVFGEDPRRACRFVGYVPQDVNRNKNFPIIVEDAAALGLLSGGPDAAWEALRRVDMWESRKKRISELSQGQRQRVRIAAALAPRPKLLVLDEPFSALDMEGHAALAAILKELRDEMTIVMVSHDISSATENADVIACVDRGLHMHGPEDFQTEMSQMGLAVRLGRCPATSFRN